MKIHGGILALVSLANACQTATAFAPISRAADIANKASRRVALGLIASPSEDTSDIAIFPPKMPMQRLEGGDTLVTFQMPMDGERVQMRFETNGRPLKARIELWLGPQRRTHGLSIDLEDGSTTPYMATLKFKKGPQVLKISTNSDLQFPMLAGVAIPSNERSEELGEITQKLWDSNIGTKKLIQGGAVTGGGGSVHTWEIPNNVESVHFMASSKAVGGKSLKALVEVLQGPNNVKQKYDLQCGGGSQPYHAVIQTLGPGFSIRLKNNKFVEDGLFEAKVVPCKVGKEAASTDGPNQLWMM